MKEAYDDFVHGFTVDDSCSRSVVWLWGDLDPLNCKKRKKRETVMCMISSLKCIRPNL